jgi:hypothetical protein
MKKLELPSKMKQGTQKSGSKTIRREYRRNAPLVARGVRLFSDGVWDSAVSSPGFVKEGAFSVKVVMPGDREGCWYVAEKP